MNITLLIELMGPLTSSVAKRARKGIRKGSGTHSQLVGQALSPVNETGTPSPASPAPALSPSCFACTCYAWPAGVDSCLLLSSSPLFISIWFYAKLNGIPSVQQLISIQNSDLLHRFIIQNQILKITVPFMGFDCIRFRSGGLFLFRSLMESNILLSFLSVWGPLGLMCKASKGSYHLSHTHMTCVFSTQFLFLQ